MMTPQSTHFSAGGVQEHTEPLPTSTPTTMCLPLAGACSEWGGEGLNVKTWSPFLGSLQSNIEWKQDRRGKIT